MNPFASTPNVEFVRQRLLALVESTALPLTNARRLALLESCRAATNGAALLDMSLEALGDSVAIPASLKDSVMDALMTGDWQGVQGMVQASATQVPSTISAGEDPFLAFRRMAITIFYASRKIQQLSLQNRRQLGSAILRTTTREELMHLFLTRLEHAQTLDPEARLKIANDVLEGRYYRLLLPDRFNCEGGGGGASFQRQSSLDNDADGIRVSGSNSLQQRLSQNHDGIQSSQSGNALNHDLDATHGVQVEHVWIDENTHDCCPICLGHVENPTTLLCQHVFCRDCILDWAHTEATASGTTSSSRGHEPDVSCPICRQSSELPAAVQASSSSSPTTMPPVRAYLRDWNIFNTRF